MKRFVINGSIDNELIEKFVQYVNSTPTEEKIIIYLTSNGGSASGAYIMLDIINKEPSKFEIHAIEKIYSAAFELFFMAECDRVIACATVGMCHMASAEMRMNTKGKPDYTCDEETLKAGKFRNAELRQLLNDIGAEKYIPKIINNSKDVYFQYDVMQGFLPKQSSLEYPVKEGIANIPKAV